MMRPPTTVKRPYPSNSVPVIAGGQRFPSVTEAARALGMPTNTVHEWAQRGVSGYSYVVRKAE